MCHGRAEDGRAGFGGLGVGGGGGREHPPARRRRVGRAALAWPSGGAPPSEAELVALYARARAASPAGLSIREVHAALVLEPALRHLTLADVKKANSKALKGGLLTAPGASADARGGAGEGGGSNRGTSASGASTHEAEAADVPRRLSRLEHHVQQAFRNFERTVGATEAECRKYGARMDATTLVALKAMSVDPTARNYALGTKALRLLEREAKEKGVVSGRHGLLVHGGHVRRGPEARMRAHAGRL